MIDDSFENKACLSLRRSNFTRSRKPKDAGPKDDEEEDDKEETAVVVVAAVEEIVDVTSRLPSTVTAFESGNFVHTIGSLLLSLHIKPPSTFERRRGRDGTSGIGGYCSPRTRWWRCLSPGESEGERLFDESDDLDPLLGASLLDPIAARPLFADPLGGAIDHLSDAVDHLATDD